MDYIQPASCTDSEFRKMWAEFEWENKITVNTNLTDLNDYLEHLLASTNMQCLTPKQALTGGCGFLAANLYARSIFGEDALANVSVEKPLVGGAESPVQGHVRIRAKTQVNKQGGICGERERKSEYVTLMQGMALSLGDKINLSQKKATAVVDPPPGSKEGSSS
jgi:coatomer subunit beta